MPTDLSHPIRRAIIAHLRADANLTALVPAEKIFAEFALSDDMPFIRMGYTDALPFEASCWSGSENTFTIHAFAKGPSTDGVGQIAKRIVESMANFSPASLDGAWQEWTGTIVLPDEVPERLHAVVTFSVTAVEVS